MSEQRLVEKTLTVFFQASILFRIARKAQRRLTRKKKSLDDALIGIVFAAASLEAFMNELTAYVAALLREELIDEISLQVFSDLLGELEDSRASIKSKFLMAKWSLSGKPYIRGAQPYQDFSALIDLRNELIHLKALESSGLRCETPVFKEPKALALLRAKKLLLTQPKNLHSWPELLINADCIKWACNTAVDMVLGIADALPQEGFWKRIKRMYRSSFRLID